MTPEDLDTLLPSRDSSVPPPGAAAGSDDPSPGGRAGSDGAGRSSALAKVLAAVALLAAGLAAVLAVSGGGGGSSATEEANLIVAAADRADEAGSARLALTTRVTGGPEAIAFDGHGIVELESGDASITLDLSGLGAAPGATAGDLEIETRIVGDTMYLRMPFLSEMAGAGTDWVSMDLSELEELEGMEGLEQLGGNDPSSTLEYLRGASDQVTEVGRDEVRGTPTTRYRADLDLRRALAEVPAGQRDAVERAVSDFEAQFGRTTFPVDVWIDDDGLPRRMRYALDLSGVEGAPADAGIELTMELFDYGIDVDVRPPPAGSVTDLTELVGAGGLA